MKFVFDFAGVLLRWHPPTLLRRELPQQAHDEASAQFWVDQIFQDYGGDWGEFDRGTVGVEELVQRNDFLHCFDDGVFSSRVHQIKPEPAIFELAARQFGAAPQDLVFLDDMPANVTAAHAMGWNALHFVDAAQAERELQQQGWLSEHHLAAERT